MHLHVGVAKTGTTYLQGILHANRDRLRRAGVCYPGSSTHAHFQASIDLRAVTFKGHDNANARGAWSRLTREVNTFSGNSLVSHETLARTARRDRARAVTGFATDDVRVVITARDLGRQVPAVWQENVKNRNSQTYDAFLHALFGLPRNNSDTESRQRRRKFWQAQDVAAVARRWARQVGGERLTIVTVPVAGTDPGELWRRFRRACELPDLDYDLVASGDNRSMGAAESEVLRRMNSRFSADFSWPQYEAQVKRGFAVSVLAADRRHGPLVLPQAWRASAEAAAGRQIEALAEAGYAVVGDLADLQPRFEVATQQSPDDLTDDELFEVALQLLAAAATVQPGDVGRPRPGRHTGRQRLIRRTVRRIRGG